MAVMYRFREGSGRLCLDYVRTLRHRGSPAAVEELPESRALAAWVGQFGPWDEISSVPSPDVVKSSHALREAIFRAIDCARAGEAVVVEADRALVNAAAEHEVPIPFLGRDQQLRWQAADPVAAVLALVARDALELITSPSAARIRQCAGEDCQALFVDESRPGNRRWCSMGTCGNRAKKQNLRGRAGRV